MEKWRGWVFTVLIFVFLYFYITTSGTASVGHSTRLHAESPLWCPAGTSCTALWVQGGKCYVLSCQFSCDNTAHDTKKKRKTVLITKLKTFKDYILSLELVLIELISIAISKMQPFLIALLVFHPSLRRRRCIFWGFSRLLKKSSSVLSPAMLL